MCTSYHVGFKCFMTFLIIHNVLLGNKSTLCFDCAQRSVDFTLSCDLCLHLECELDTVIVHTPTIHEHTRIFLFLSLLNLLIA